MRKAVKLTLAWLWCLAIGSLVSAKPNVADYRRGANRDAKAQYVCEQYVAHGGDRKMEADLTRVRQEFRKEFRASPFEGKCAPVVRSAAPAPASAPAAPAGPAPAELKRLQDEVDRLTKELDEAKKATFKKIEKEAVGAIEEEGLGILFGEGGMKAAFETAKQERDDLREKLKAANESLAKITKEVDEARKADEVADAAREKASKEQLDVILAERDALIKRLGECDKALDQAKKELAACKGGEGAYKTRIDQDRDKIAALEEQLRKCQEDLTKEDERHDTGEMEKKVPASESIGQKTPPPPAPPAPPPSKATGLLIKAVPARKAGERPLTPEQELKERLAEGGGLKPGEARKPEVEIKKTELDLEDILKKGLAQRFKGANADGEGSDDEDERWDVAQLDPYAGARQANTVPAQGATGSRALEEGRAAGQEWLEGRQSKESEGLSGRSAQEVADALVAFKTAAEIEREVESMRSLTPTLPDDTGKEFIE